MIQKLGLVILVLAAGILLFWSQEAWRGERATEPPESERAPALSVSLDPPPAPSAAPAGSPRAEVTRTALPEELQTAATNPAAAVERFRLRGVLLHSSDRRPAGYEELVFHFGEESAPIATDAAGRFETGAVVPRGPVRAWHMGANLPIEPETLLFEPRSDGAPMEVVLVLRDPAAWLALEVVTWNGAPTAAEIRWRFHPGVVSDSARVRSGRSPTDARGRVDLPFPSADPGARMVLLARAGDDLVSDMVVLEAPLADVPLQLVLERGGRIRARVVREGGIPLEGKRIQLRTQDRDLSVDEATSDAAGVASFGAVAPGNYRLEFWHAESSDWIAAHAKGERGRTSEVELVVPVLPLAVAGRVLDEAGLPLEEVRIVAAFDDGHTTTTLTYAGGAFSVTCLGSGAVRLSTEPELSGDRYEPAELVVPFGTSDIVIRRREPLPLSTLALEILDRNTLARIPQAMALGFVEPLRENWSFHRAPDGLLALDLKLYEDAWLALDAFGYRRQVLRALDLARAGPEGGPCRVLLEPGLERSLSIFDQQTGQPLRGALVFDAERLVATSDGDGHARVELPSWPAELRIQAADHADGIWACKEWLAELGDGAIWLERTSHDTAPADR